MSPPHRNRRKAAVTASGRRDRAKNTIPTSILKKPTNKRGIIKTQKKTRRSSRRFTTSRHDPSDLLSDDDNADAEGSESGSSDEEEDEEPKPREFAPSDALESELHGIEIEDVPTPSPSDQEKEHQVGLEDGVMDEDGGLISLGDFVFGALDAKLPEVDVDDSCDESMLREVLATEEARNSGMLTDFVYTYDQLRDSESSSEDEVDDNKIEEEETFALINEFSKPDAEWDCVQLTSHKELKAHVAVEQAMFQTSDESDRETTSIMNFSLPFEDDEDDDFDFTSNFALSEMNSAFTTPKATAPVSPSSSIFPFSTPFSTGLLTPSSLRRPSKRIELYLIEKPTDTNKHKILMILRTRPSQKCALSPRRSRYVIERRCLPLPVSKSLLRVKAHYPKWASSHSPSTIPSSVRVRPVG